MDDKLFFQNVCLRLAYGNVREASEYSKRGNLLSRPSYYLEFTMPKPEGHWQGTEWGKKLAAFAEANGNAAFENLIRDGGKALFFSTSNLYGPLVGGYDEDGNPQPDRFIEIEPGDFVSAKITMTAGGRDNKVFLRTDAILLEKKGPRIEPPPAIDFDGFQRMPNIEQTLASLPDGGAAYEQANQHRDSAYAGDNDNAVKRAIARKPLPQRRPVAPPLPPSNPRATSNWGDFDDDIPF